MGAIRNFLFVRDITLVEVCALQREVYMLVKMLQFICPDEFYGFWVQSVRASLKSTRIFLTLCVLHLGKSSTLRRILLAISVIYELCMQGKKAKN